jgi:hypothetical protein
MHNALHAARSALDGSGADAALQTWFGVQKTKDNKPILARRISFLRSHINNTPITFSLTGDDHPHTNADAIPFNLKGGNGLNTWGVYQQLVVQNTKVVVDKTSAVKDESVVRLGKNFKNLPSYGTTPLSTFNGQEQFETLAHELTHVILGTSDETLNNGATAYGAAAARLLATQDVAKAFNNAENWGFFIEEFI